MSVLICSRRVRGVTRAVGAILLSAVAGLASAQEVPRTEVIPFPTKTMNDAQFLGNGQGADATIAGVLRLPSTKGKLPAVVLLHGSSGVGGYVDAWVPRLNALGIATFVPDSFSGRNLTAVGNDQAALGRLAGTYDAYRALDALAHNPRIDPERIVLMGFSRGGQGALYAAMQRFQTAYGPKDASYNAYIAYYPNCVSRYIDDDKLVDRPVRIFHGLADDFNPANVCLAYTERLTQAGNDVVMRTYPGAHHVFDWAGLQPVGFSAKAQSARDCHIVETTPGVLTNTDTGQPFSYADACVQKGTHAGYQAEAAQSAIPETIAFLKQRLKLVD